MNDVARILKKHRVKTYGCCVLVVLALLSFYTLDISNLELNDWDPANIWRTELQPERIDNEPSGYVGGVPGYQVFENLWFNDNTFHWFNDEPIPIPVEEVMRGSDSIVRHSSTEVEQIVAQDTNLRFQGETIFVNSGYGTGSVPKLVQWYYHFATELLMGSMSVLSSLPPGPSDPDHPAASKPLSRSEVAKGDLLGYGSKGDKMPDHLIVPLIGWNDNYGLNDFLVKGTIGSALVDKDKWDSLVVVNRWIRFDRVLIFDREASGLDPVVQRWNKMAAHALTLPRSLTVFEPLRRRMSKYLGIHPIPLRGGGIGKSINKPHKAPKVPKVIYVDRQDTSRHLVPEAHDRLMTLLRDMEAKEEIIFVDGRFGGGMSVKDQIGSVMDADIIIGVHGNGLTHQLFMPPGGHLIEIFPPDSFLRDYQLVAESLTHIHHAVRNDTTYPRSEWERNPGEQNPGILHDGTHIPLDGEYIASLLRSVVVEMTT